MSENSLHHQDDFERETRVLCNFLKKIESGAFVTATAQTRAVQMEVAEQVKNSLPPGTVQVLDCYTLDNNYIYTARNLIDLLNDNIKAVFLINFQEITRNLSDNDFFFNLNMGRDLLAEQPITFVFFCPQYFLLQMASYAPDFYSFVRMHFKFPSEEKSKNLF